MSAVGCIGLLLVLRGMTGAAIDGGNSSARVSSAVDFLFAATALASAHQITAALDHPARRRIYEHLLLLPGNHFRGIVRSLRIGFSSAQHHLNVLLRHGYVRQEKTKGRCRYYPNGREGQVLMNQLYHQHWDFRDLRSRVLLVVRRAESAGPTSVGKSLGISRQLAAYHLARLEEIGYVRRERGGYRAMPKLAARKSGGATWSGKVPP